MSNQLTLWTGEELREKPLPGSDIVAEISSPLLSRLIKLVSADRRTTSRSVRKRLVRRAERAAARLATRVQRRIRRRMLVVFIVIVRRGGVAAAKAASAAGRNRRRRRCWRQIQESPLMDGGGESQRRRRRQRTVFVTGQVQGLILVVRHLSSQNGFLRFICIFWKTLCLISIAVG